MTKVHVFYEVDDNIWKILYRKLEGNEIIISRKVRKITTEKYRHGLPGLGRVEDQESMDLTGPDGKEQKRFWKREKPQYEEEVESVSIKDLCMSADEDCRPITISYRMFMGHHMGFSGRGFWREGPMYKATYKSHKIQPFGKNTIIPMDPKLYKEMSENDSLHELLKRDTTALNILILIAVLGAGVLLGHTISPMITSYMNPPANATISTARNGTITVVKGVIGLWMIPSLKRLKRR